jgi:hypothetical protein
MASIFDDYNTQGANNGMFAPAYIKGNPTSESAVAAWNAARPTITPDVLTQSRGLPPQSGIPPNKYANFTGYVPADFVPSPQYTNFAGQGGPIDRDALRALAQHLPYDLDARRNAIAAQLATRQADPASQAPQQLTQAQVDELGRRGLLFGGRTPTAEEIRSVFG